MFWDIGDLGAWAWLIAGLVLVGSETITPGIFLVWIGLAAIVTGLVDIVFGLPWQLSALLFAALAVTSAAGGRALTRERPVTSETALTLNRRGEALVGRVFLLDRPMVRGEGQVRVDDSVWRVIGPDAPAGASVRVTRVEGSTLHVEHSILPG